MMVRNHIVVERLLQQLYESTCTLEALECMLQRVPYKLKQLPPKTNERFEEALHQLARRKKKHANAA